jgi:hypothetical protein
MGLFLACSYVEAVALLHQHLRQQLDLDSTSWPLLHRAVLAGAAAAPAVDYLSTFFAGLEWQTSNSSSVKRPQHGFGQGSKRKRSCKEAAGGVDQTGWADECTAAWLDLLHKCPVSIAPGLDAAYDAAAQRLQGAEDAWSAGVDQELSWYRQEQQQQQPQRGFGSGGQVLAMQKGGAAALIDPPQGLVVVSLNKFYVVFTHVVSEWTLSPTPGVVSLFFSKLLRHSCSCRSLPLL